MPSMWQRKYAGRVRQAQRDMDRFFGEVERPEIPLQTTAYQCVEGGCGYFEEKYIQSPEDPHCPACGSKMQREHLFAACPRCGVEHNIVFALANNGIMHSNADTLIAYIAAETLCHECRKQGRRLPKKYRERGAKIDFRREIL